MTTTRPSLLLRIRDAEDAASWQAFVDVYGPLVYEFCRRRGLQDSDAAEVMQEVMLQVSRSIGSFDYAPRQGRFRGWLGTVTRHKLYRFLKQNRKYQGSVEFDEHDASGSGDRQWDEEFNSHLLRTAMQRIEADFEPATWQAFRATWLDEVPAAEAARRLERSVDWVYVAKSRVLKRLQETVRELADDDGWLP